MTTNWRYFWNMFIRGPLLRFYWGWREQNTPTTCGHECHWVYPYGFVPETCCPVHDPVPIKRKQKSRQG